MERLFVYRTARLRTFRRGNYKTVYTNKGEDEILEEYSNAWKAFWGHTFWVRVLKNGDLD
jgi:hypothetical protein